MSLVDHVIAAIRIDALLDSPWLDSAITCGMLYLLFWSIGGLVGDLRKGRK